VVIKVGHAGEVQGERKAPATTSSCGGKDAGVSPSSIAQVIAMLERQQAAITRQLARLKATV
jgi:hypothetical protein